MLSLLMIVWSRRSSAIASCEKHGRIAGWLALAGALMLIVAAVPAATAQGAAATAEDYRLAPGDTVDFDILNDAQSAVQVTIGAQGRVLVPLAGEVAVGGLTLSEAREAVAEAYRAGEFLINPNVGLSLAAFGDVYVIGDVRNPGSFPFRPQLTVEQAVALAGGYSALFTPAQGATLQIAELRHELLDASSEIVRQAVWEARLRAQIAGRRTIDEGDLPATARPFLDAELLDPVQAVEARILAVQFDSYGELREAHTFAIQETERELEFLTQRLEKQDAAMAFTRQDLALERNLIDMRRRAPEETSDLERQLIAEEAIALGIMTQISQARTRVSAERTALTQLESQWMQDALFQLQERRAAIRRLVSQHGAILERLSILGGIALQTAEPSSPIPASFKIRRNEASGSSLFAAQETTVVVPGDVVVVSNQPASPGG